MPSADGRDHVANSKWEESVEHINENIGEDVIEQRT